MALRDKYVAREPPASARNKGGIATIADQLKSRAASFDTERPDGRLPGPRPGVKRSGVLQAVDAAAGGPAGGDGDDGALFRVAPTRGADDDDLVQFARANPGQLLGLAIEEIDRYLAAREGAGPSENAGVTASRFVTYLTTVFHAAHPPAEVGERATSELRTIAESLDAITRGDLARACDLLTQRFKSVELQASGSSSTLARQHELIPPARVGLAREGERTFAAKSEVLRARLEELAKKKSAG